MNDDKLTMNDDEWLKWRLKWINYDVSSTFLRIRYSVYDIIRHPWFSHKMYKKLGGISNDRNNMTMSHTLEWNREQIEVTFELKLNFG